jgi:hypothetical protein
MTLQVEEGGCLKIVDRVLGSLLIFGGIGHTAGSLRFYQADPMMSSGSVCRACEPWS